MRGAKTSSAWRTRGSSLEEKFPATFPEPFFHLPRQSRLTDWDFYRTVRRHLFPALFRLHLVRLPHQGSIPMTMLEAPFWNVFFHLDSLKNVPRTLNIWDYAVRVHASEGHCKVSIIGTITIRKEHQYVRCFWFPSRQSLQFSGGTPKGVELLLNTQMQPATS